MCNHCQLLLLFIAYYMGKIFHKNFFFTFGLCNKLKIRKIIFKLRFSIYLNYIISNKKQMFFSDTYIMCHSNRIAYVQSKIVLDT